MGRGFLAVLALSFICAACTRLPDADNGDEPADSPTPVAITSPTATTTSIIIPTVTATMTPEPPQPSLTATDQPVTDGSDAVMDDSNVDVQVAAPEVTVADQELADEDLIFIDRVVATEPGWITIQADQDDSPGEVLGFAPVDRGENENVAIKLNWREASPTLHAVLYEDDGEMGRFEGPEKDKLVVVGEDPVAATFRATFPPDILVVDQPVLNGSITVERATSFGPGWVAIYQDDNGGLGNIIGWSRLEDGVNHDIVITTTESAVTPILYLMLHEDQETIGEFGFPRTDPQVRYQGRLPNPFSMRTDAGNFIITQDQVLSDTNTVTVPLIVVDLNAWIVIRDGSLTEPGEISGMQWLPAGYHRDVVVEIDPEIISEIMHAVLHLDGGISQEFEYPEGPDITFQRNRNVIQAPFELRQEGDNT